METADPMKTPAPQPQVVLPDGDRACLSCGQRVMADRAGEETTFTAHGQASLVGAQEITRDLTPPVETVMTRCPACRDRLQAARLLLDQHPSFVRRLGRESAEHQLSAALDAFAALGLDYPREWSKREVTAALRHLTAPGVAARFSRRFAPVLALGARPGTATVAPWAHLTAEQRAAIRHGHAQLLAARVARAQPDVHLRPPQGRACAFCGLGAVVMPAEQVAEKGGREWATRDVWQPVSVDPRTLGGRRHQPRREPAALCLDCSVSREEVGGSVGQRAMLHAYGEHLLRLGLIDEEQAIKTGRVVGVLGWLALEQMDRLDGQPPTPVNDQPWAHLPSEEMPGVLRRRS